MPDDIKYTIGLFLLYFLPVLVAYSRKHRSAMAIGFLNVFLGWTLLGWLIAMVWSLTGNVEEKAPARR